jgi:hypothetical protein
MVIQRVKLRRRYLAILFIASLVMAADEASDDLSVRPRPFGIDYRNETLPENSRDFGNGKFSDFPNWPVSHDQPNDVFTFVRLRYPSYSDSNGGRRRGFSKWTTDYPDGDMNFSFRLQQMTSLRVNPNPVICDIEPEQLRHYPFVYMVEPGHIDLPDEQAKALRDYLLNGGFMMVDDFWGIDEWDTFEVALKKIWPDRSYVELELDHDIFHCVFELQVKPQIPSIGFAEMARQRGITHFNEWNKRGSEIPHFRGVYDDKKRLCMIICWNTDHGDGWEEEGTDPWYFREFSEKYAYPMGINIVFYAMTH